VLVAFGGLLLAKLVAAVPERIAADAPTAALMRTEETSLSAACQVRG